MLLIVNKILCVYKNIYKKIVTQDYCNACAKIHSAAPEIQNAFTRLRFMRRGSTGYPWNRIKSKQTFSNQQSLWTDVLTS